MPLDRIIELGLEAEGEFVRGQYVAGPIKWLTVWAQRQSQGSVDQETSAGTRVRVIAGWIIRYRQDVARQPINRLHLRAQDGMWNIESVNESDSRRRFLEIGAVRIDPEN